MSNGASTPTTHSLPIEKIGEKKLPSPITIHNSHKSSLLHILNQRRPRTYVIHQNTNKSWLSLSFAGVVPEQKSEMASPRENGGGQTRAFRVSRSQLLVQDGSWSWSGAWAGSFFRALVICSVAICPAWVFGSPSCCLPKLPSSSFGWETSDASSSSTCSRSSHYFYSCFENES